MTPKPDDESHLAQIAREAQERNAAEEAALEKAQQQRQAREKLAEYRNAWPKIREEYLLDKIRD